MKTIIVDDKVIDVNFIVGASQREKVATLQADGFVIQNVLVRMARVKNNRVECISVYPEGATVQDLP